MTVLKLIPDDPEGRERAKQAATKRAYRARLKAGGASLKGVPITDINVLTGALIELGWLPEDQSEDRKAIAAAVGAMLDDLASRHH